MNVSFQIMKLTIQKLLNKNSKTGIINRSNKKYCTIFSYSNFDTQSTFILTDKPESLQLPFLFVDNQTSWLGSFKLIYNFKLTIRRNEPQGFSVVVETEINFVPHVRLTKLQY